MRLRVYHRTEYTYASSVTQSSNELRLCPLDTPFQRCESFFPGVIPATRLTHFRDLFSNVVHYFELPEPHDRLVIETRATVLTQSKVDYGAFPYGMKHLDLPQCLEREECYPFLQDSHYVEVTPAIWKHALDVADTSEDVFQTSYAIMEHIYRNFEYQSGTTKVTTHAREVFEQRRGVCQDFAHLMLALCRALRIPARYVSGYLFDPTWDHRLRGNAASHAWVEVYLLREGWVGLDPTNNKVVDGTYIKVATGRDYADVAPVTGTYFGSGISTMHVTVDVKRLSGEEKPLDRL